MEDSLYKKRTKKLIELLKKESLDGFIFGEKCVKDKHLLPHSRIVWFFPLSHLF